jgi:hypothetical protein
MDFTDQGSEFLRGTSTSDECKPMFDQYEKCLSVSGLTKASLLGQPLPQKALSERGIDKMLKEVREDNKENDTEHMRPVSQTQDPREPTLNVTTEPVSHIERFPRGLQCTLRVLELAPRLGSKLFKSVRYPCMFISVFQVNFQHKYERAIL